jgi:hypothetical protein
MPVISDSIFRVRLPSGNGAVYSLEPQFVNPPMSECLPEPRPGALGANSSLTDRCIRHGTQVAHEKDGTWYKPASWEEITDPLTLALIDRAPDAEPAVSWKPEVSTDATGKYYQNNLAFATKAEAETSARDLAGRWMLVRAWRAAPSQQPVNARIVDNTLELLPAPAATGA